MACALATRSGMMSQTALTATPSRSSKTSSSPVPRAPIPTSPIRTLSIGRAFPSEASAAKHSRPMAHAVPAAAPIFTKLLRSHSSFMVFLPGKVKQRGQFSLSHGFAGGQQAVDKVSRRKWLEWQGNRAALGSGPTYQPLF